MSISLCCVFSRPLKVFIVLIFNFFFYLGFILSFPAHLTSVFLSLFSAGWVMSTLSSRDSSSSWRRETILATRPGAEIAATEPSTCFPSDPSSVL